MISSCWRATNRHVDRRLTPCIRSSPQECPARGRAYLWPRLASRARVQHLQSRAYRLPDRHRPYVAPGRTNIKPGLRLLWQNPPFRTNQSAFPKKTFFALLVLGGALWYFDVVSLSIDTEWPDRIQDVFSENPTARPLQFYDDRAQLDHWIQEHVEVVDSPSRDPSFVQYINDSFEKIANGWSLSEEEAVEAGMPMTHGCRYRVNDPCEDYFALGTSPGPGDRAWNYWGIYDGHAGKHTAHYLQWALIPHVSRDLCSLPPSAPSYTIIKTITQTFTRLDDNLLSLAKRVASWHPAASATALAALAPVFSGSCALLSIFDPDTSKLRVACVGDSRAVLGRWDPVSQKYTAQALSEDQTGFNESEVERINSAHPDEENILDPNTGRLLGIAVTRAFGDHRWKWDNDFIKQLQIKFWGSAPRPGSKTPPYMTASPVVVETDVVRADPRAPPSSPSAPVQKSDFLIMASDGLWDRISSEHAVELVDRWLAARARGNGSVRDDPHFSPPDMSASHQLHLDPGVDVDVAESREISWKAEPRYFAIEDDNAAVCLARNAMGGTRKGLFMGLLSVPSPLARMAVDDTTIMVVFFDRLRDKGAKKEKGAEARKWWRPW